MMIILIVNLFLVVSCKSFDPKKYVVDGQSAECNDFYITMGYYSLVEKSDSAFVGTVYGGCQSARKAERQLIREQHCKGMYFGNEYVDKTNYEKYSQYLECTK
jgi:hypothetical protein